MTLHEPVKNFSFERYPKGDVEQYFAEGDGLYTVTKAHSGWDIIRKWGEPIYAMADCVIAHIDHDEENGFGNHIRALTDTQCHIYGHLSEILVTLNQQVKAGDLIGKMGNTGFVVSQGILRKFWKTAGIVLGLHPGTHLHISVIPTEETDVYDPNNGYYQFANGMKRKFTNFNDGYGGCVDPSVYFKTPYNFKKSLQFGQFNDEILYAQFILKKQGVLDPLVDTTGKYGLFTKNAVLKLQMQNSVASQEELIQLDGKYIGVKTRALLNSLSLL